MAAPANKVVPPKVKFRVTFGSKNITVTLPKTTTVTSLINKIKTWAQNQQNMTLASQWTFSYEYGSQDKQGKRKYGWYSPKINYKSISPADAKKQATNSSENIFGITEAGKVVRYPLKEKDPIQHAIIVDHNEADMTVGDAPLSLSTEDATSLVVVETVKIRVDCDYEALQERRPDKYAQLRPSYDLSVPEGKVDADALKTHIFLFTGIIPSDMRLLSANRDGQVLNGDIKLSEGDRVWVTDAEVEKQIEAEEREKERQLAEAAEAEAAEREREAEQARARAAAANAAAEAAAKRVVPSPPMSPIRPGRTASAQTEDDDEPPVISRLDAKKSASSRKQVNLVEEDDLDEEGSAELVTYQKKTSVAAASPKPPAPSSKQAVTSPRPPAPFDHLEPPTQMPPTVDMEEGDDDLNPRLRKTTASSVVDLVDDEEEAPAPAKKHKPARQEEPDPEVDAEADADADAEPEAEPEQDEEEAAAEDAMQVDGADQGEVRAVSVIDDRMRDNEREALVRWRNDVTGEEADDWHAVASIEGTAHYQLWEDYVAEKKKQRKEEEAARRKTEADEKRKKQKADEEAKKRAEEEAARKKVEEDNARKKAEEAASKKKADSEEASTKKKKSTESSSKKKADAMDVDHDRKSSKSEPTKKKSLSVADAGAAEEKQSSKKQTEKEKKKKRKSRGDEEVEDVAEDATHADDDAEMQPPAAKKKKVLKKSDDESEDFPANGKDRKVDAPNTKKFDLAGKIVPADGQNRRASLPAGNQPAAPEIINSPQALAAAGSVVSVAGMMPWGSNYIFRCYMSNGTYRQVSLEAVRPSLGGGIGAMMDFLIGKIDDLQSQLQAKFQ